MRRRRFLPPSQGKDPRPRHTEYPYRTHRGHIDALFAQDRQLPEIREHSARLATPTGPGLRPGSRTVGLPLFRMKDDRPGQTMMVYLACSEPGGRQ